MQQFQRTTTRYDVEPIPFHRQQDAYSIEEERAEERRRTAEGRAHTRWQRRQRRGAYIAAAFGAGILVGISGPLVAVAVAGAAGIYLAVRARRAYRQAVALGWL